MSIESWKEEFYEIDAYDIAQNEDDLGMVDHCLKKWEGLLPENLAKHNLRHKSFTIVEIDNEKEYFETDCNSCALCQAYDNNDCLDCPITLSRGYPCAEEGDWIEGTDEEEREPAPWYEWTTRKNPEPMIRCLNKTKEYLNDRISRTI